MQVDKFLGDLGKYDPLGVLNGFRKLSELYIKQLVDSGKWFTVCHKIDGNQEDIMAIRNNEDVKLGSMIGDIFQEGSYRSNIYRYLLANFLCYIEVPAISFRSDTGGKKQTFNKILATANTHVIASWLGVDVEDLDSKYTARVFGITMDDGDDLLPYVKLTETKDGVRKVTCPRANIDVSERGTRVIPLFMLKSGVDTLYNHFKEDIVKVTFLKDNSQVRDIFTTVNFSKIRDIYGTGSFYDDSVMMAYNGDFINNPTLSRGYIRIPEIGGSKYDNATRSISYARIISIDYKEEPDLSFIDIDLSTVVDSFTDCVMQHESKAGEIIDMLEAFGIDYGYWNSGSEDNPSSHSRNLTSLMQWSDEKNMLFSTVFVRDLCLFMLSNPQWVSSFDGKPKDSFMRNNGDVGLM